MDPISVGMAVASVIASKALERTGEEAVDAGASGLGRIVEAIRARIGRANDAQVELALERVDDAPDSPTRERELAAAVDDLLRRDQFGLASDLHDLLARAEQAGLQLSGPISQNASGSGPTAQVAGNVRDVNITQNAPGAPE